jgi:hypothetical protein
LQWHPFTISSSPSDDFVSVHIRVRREEKRREEKRREKKRREEKRKEEKRREEKRREEEKEREEKRREGKEKSDLFPFQIVGDWTGESV